MHWLFLDGPTSVDPQTSQYPALAVKGPDGLVLEPKAIGFSLKDSHDFHFRPAAFS